jgi:hypothetical protein
MHGAVSCTYAHAPRPTKGPVTFVLDEDRLTVDSGGGAKEVDLAGVELVRVTFETKSLSRNAYQTRLRLKDGRSVTFSSLNWKSFFDAVPLDREYRIFTRALFDAIGRANPKARFQAGKPMLVWIATAILALTALGAMIVFIWRALQTGASSAALMGTLIALIGIWQVEPMIRLNRPRHFDPHEPPADLMP